MLFLHSSISLSFGAFIRPWSLPSFIHHALITRSIAPSIHRLDLLSSVLHSPLLVSSSVLLSSLQSTAQGHGAVAVQLHLVLLMLERRLSHPPFIILPRRPLGISLLFFRPSLSSLCPSVLLSIHPSALQSLSSSVFRVRAH